MKKWIVMMAVAGLFAAGSALAASHEEASGEALFKKHCAACHPGGGNIINPKKTLSAKDLEANGIKGVAGIVDAMRKPGPGMMAFDPKTLPDKEAKEIAEYILKSF